MSNLLKLLKKLKAQKWASAEDKELLKALFTKLEGEDQDSADAVKEDVEEAEKLPEEDPQEAKDEEEAVKAVKGFVNAQISLELSKAKAEIEATLVEWKKKQEALIQSKSGVYAEGLVEKRAKVNSYLRELSKAILAGDKAKVKDLTTTDAGAEIVDSELSAEIRHLMTDYGVARREFFTTALSKNAYDANALATDVVVGWVSEAGVIGSTQVVLNQEELKLKKLGAIAYMTRELLEDQEVDLFSFIAERVAEGFAKAEDSAFFKGEGTGDTANGEFTGLLFHDDVVDVDEYDGSALTVENIYALIDALPQGAHANAKFYFHRTWLSKIRLLKDGDGRYIYQNPLEVSGIPTLAGYPVVLVEAMPTSTQDDDPFILFGDLRKSSILGFKNGIAVDRFNAGVVRNLANNADVNLITTDREAIRWISRVGAITILPSAVVRLAPSGS